jgi:DNA-directed RNA polymerase specialized sigma24 family protein
MLTEVSGYLRRNGYSEDALQEGLIAAWEAEQKNPGQQTGYYARVARNGAKSYLLGKRTTGRNAQGKKSLASLVPVEKDTLSALGGVYDEDVATRIDVERALDTLNDSHYEYVRLRFFEGETHEVAAKKAGIAYTAWSYTIRPRLGRLLSEDSI